MPTFKPKSSKTIKVSSKSTTTLDSKHREIIDKINNDEDNILPELEDKNENLRKSYYRLKVLKSS